MSKCGFRVTCTKKLFGCSVLSFPLSHSLSLCKLFLHHPSQWDSDLRLIPRLYVDVFVATLWLVPLRYLVTQLSRSTWPRRRQRPRPSTLLTRFLFGRADVILARVEERQGADCRGGGVEGVWGRSDTSPHPAECRECQQMSLYTHRHANTPTVCCAQTLYTGRTSMHLHNQRAKMVFISFRANLLFPFILLRNWLMWRKLQKLVRKKKMEYFKVPVLQNSV